jgi:hypothetical protein
MSQTRPLQAVKAEAFARWRPINVFCALRRIKRKMRKQEEENARLNAKALRSAERKRGGKAPARGGVTSIAKPAHGPAAVAAEKIAHARAISRARRGKAGVDVAHIAEPDKAVATRRAAVAASINLTLDAEGPILQRPARRNKRDARPKMPKDGRDGGLPAEDWSATVGLIKDVRRPQGSDENGTKGRKTRPYLPKNGRDGGDGDTYAAVASGSGHKDLRRPQGAQREKAPGKPRAGKSGAERRIGAKEAAGGIAAAQAADATARAQGVMDARADREKAERDEAAATKKAAAAAHRAEVRRRANLSPAFDYYTRVEDPLSAVPRTTDAARAKWRRWQLTMLIQLFSVFGMVFGSTLLRATWEAIIAPGVSVYTHDALMVMAMAWPALQFVDWGFVAGGRIAMKWQPLITFALSSAFGRGVQWFGDFSTVETLFLAVNKLMLTGLVLWWFMRGEERSIRHEWVPLGECSEEDGGDYRHDALVGVNLDKQGLVRDWILRRAIVDELGHVHKALPDVRLVPSMEVAFNAYRPRADATKGDLERMLRDAHRIASVGLDRTTARPNSADAAQLAVAWRLRDLCDQHSLYVMQNFADGPALSLGGWSY